MRNLLNNSQMPMGLGMAFAENMEAMSRFSAMTNAEQQVIITRARTIHSKADMQALVRSLIQ